MIKKGSIASCPKCGDEVMEALQDVKTRQVMTHDLFKSLQGLQLTFKTEVKCVKCGDGGQTPNGNHYLKPESWENPNET